MNYFTLTVDTEADDAWETPEKLELKNFQEVIRFQELCEKYNIVATYLLTYEYATYQPAIDYFKQKVKENKCEVGYHLHVWSTPPFDNEKNGVDINWLHAYQYEIPDDLFLKKANRLFDTIVANFGIKPIIHRAGRYGIDQRTIDWLISRRFKIDTSVVPLCSFKLNKGKSLNGPDFSDNSQVPYVWNGSDDSLGIYEIPVSVVEPNNFSNFISRYVIIKKVFKKFGYYKMIRPYPNNRNENIRNINRLAKQGKNINYMLHSSELALKCSPITMTINNYNRIWRNLEATFNYINEKGIKSIKISQLIELIPNKKLAKKC